ncbi:hypothetical protein BH24CHL6_BH24CHL6_15670 [soil metagenome]
MVTLGNDLVPLGISQQNCRPAVPASQTGIAGSVSREPRAEALLGRFLLAYRKVAIGLRLEQPLGH